MAVVLVGAPRAEAGPMGIRFAGTLDYGTLAGTAIWGSFFWEDLGPTQLTAPISALTLNVGSRRFDLSHGMYPAFVQSPYLDPNVGLGNTWGPRYDVRPEFLFGGLTHLSLFEGGSVFVLYSYLPASPIQYLTQTGVALVPMASVPEPGSLLLGLGALAGALLARRRAGAGRRPR